MRLEDFADDDETPYERRRRVDAENRAFFAASALASTARKALLASPPPPFCGVCCQPRKGLTPKLGRSTGASRAERVTWRCVDCVEAGALAELGQHEVQDGKQNAQQTGLRDGNRQVGRKR